jgi:hypothetical protein
VSTSKDRKFADRDPLREHELAKKLVRDGKPVDYLTIRGYVGKSDSEDKVRLYLNKEFNDYVQIKKSDILHAEEISQEELEFGGTCIWLDKDAEITKVKTQSKKQQARFMAGEISRAQLRPEFVSRAIQDDQGVSLFAPVCPSDFVPCTREWFCEVIFTASGTYCEPTPFCPTPRCFTRGGHGPVCQRSIAICYTPDCPITDPGFGTDPTSQLKLQIDKLRAKLKKLEEEKA